VIRQAACPEFLGQDFGHFALAGVIVMNAVEPFDWCRTLALVSSCKGRRDSSRTNFVPLVFELDCA
jgi:hypothetical protein